MSHKVSSFWAGAASVDHQVDLGLVGETLGDWPAVERKVPSAWEAIGLSQKLALRWRSGKSYSTRGRAVTLASSVYPTALAKTPFPPAVLHVLGAPSAWQRRCIAIVGARNCSPLGAAVAWRLAWSFVHSGWTVVSGLARGVDAAAHRGALSAGKGSTVAVLAHGLDHLAPAQHRQLAREIAQSGGALVTTLQDHEVPLPGRFPQRNRWIAGMCEHVVVVEAGVRSGALGTARHGVEQGRGIHTFPWGLGHPVAQGCHRLVAAGSGIISDVEEFVAEVTGEAPLVHPEWLKRVFDGVALEKIAQETGRSFSWVLGELGGRVAGGEVERLPGQRYAPAGPIRSHRGQDDFGDLTRESGPIL